MIRYAVSVVLEVPRVRLQKRSFSIQGLIMLPGVSTHLLARIEALLPVLLHEPLWRVTFGARTLYTNSAAYLLSVYFFFGISRLGARS